MLRHHDIAVDTKAETAPNAFEPGLEGKFRRGLGERWSATLAAERHKVSLPGLVKALQSPRHIGSLALKTAPLKQKKLEWATRRKEL